MLGDDDCVHVYASPEDVVRSTEGLDAEESIRSALDELGRPYRVVWLEPNHCGPSLLGIRAAQSGRYALVPSGAPNPDALRGLLRQDRPVFTYASIDGLEEVLVRARSSNPGA